MRLARWLAVVGMVLLFVSILPARDAHYWANQYGTHGELLGGAVVGSIEDTSAAFYNPAALSFIHRPNINISVNAYLFEHLSLADGAGKNEDLNSNKFVPTPTILSGLWRLSKHPDHVFAWSILTRNQYDIEVFGQRQAVLDALASRPGNETYFGTFKFSERLTEVWAGLSWAWRARSNLSFGITQFLAVRQQAFDSYSQSRAVVSPIDIAQVENFRDFSYIHVRLLWKAGVFWDLDRFKTGLTVTTPSVGVWGDGTSRETFNIFNIDYTGDLIVDLPFLGEDAQRVLDSEYRSPVSVAWGGMVRFGAFRTHVAVEWFGSVGGFTAIQARDATGLLPAPFPMDLNVRHNAVSVFNAGIGFDYAFSKDVKGYLSFRIDRSAEDKDDSDLVISNWDVYHFMTGMTFETKHYELGIGLGVSFGQGGAQQVMDFTDPQESNLLRGSISSTQVTYLSFRGMIGYIYHFN